MKTQIPRLYILICTADIFFLIPCVYFFPGSPCIYHWHQPDLLGSVSWLLQDKMSNKQQKLSCFLHVCASWLGSWLPEKVCALREDSSVTESFALTSPQGCTDVQQYHWIHEVPFFSTGMLIWGTLLYSASHFHKMYRNTLSLRTLSICQACLKLAEGVRDCYSELKLHFLDGLVGSQITFSVEAGERGEKNKRKKSNGRPWKK